MAFGGKGRKGEGGGSATRLGQRQTGLPKLPVLPPDVLLLVLSFLHEIADASALLLVSRDWSASVASAFYWSPPLRDTDFSRFTALLVTRNSYHPYAVLVQRLDISGATADGMEMGDLETALGQCSNLTSLRLTACPHISSILLQSLADFCPRLEHLELRGCPVGDGYLPDLVASCPRLRVLDLSQTNVSSASLAMILVSLRPLSLERLNLDGLITDMAAGSAVAIDPDVAPCLCLRILSLQDDTPIAPNLIRSLSPYLVNLTTLFLNSSSDFATDDLVAAVAQCLQSLTDLELDWCPKITDLALQSLAVHSAPRGLLRRVWCCGTGVTSVAVRLLVRECLSLIDLRLDGCARLLGSNVEDIAIRSWTEKNSVRRSTAADLGSRKLDSIALTSPVRLSRLPVLAGRRRDRSGSSTTSNRVKPSVSRGLTPPSGWCRLEGIDMMDKIAQLEL